MNQIPRAQRPVRFKPGRIVATPAVLETVPMSELMEALSRHLSGDWGEVSAPDAMENEHALVEDTRILSVYHSSQKHRFWVITEADRSSTTILLPEEY